MTKRSQQTCRCSAYPFPHRHTSGKCDAPSAVTVKGKMYTASPRSDCRYCYGSGTVSQSHPYGDTYATEYLVCDCVMEQMPESFDYHCEVEVLEWIS